jgi:hypothetical protein
LLANGWIALHLMQREPMGDDAPRSAAQGALQPLAAPQQAPATPTAPAEPQTANAPEAETQQEVATPPGKARNPSRAPSAVAARAKPRAQTAMALRPTRRDAVSGMASPALDEPALPVGTAADDDDVRDMFFPASRRPTNAAPIAPAEGASVANEAPILD